MSADPSVLRKLGRLLKDLLTTGKPVSVTIDIVPGNGRSPFIQVTSKPDIRDMADPGE